MNKHLIPPDLRTKMVENVDGNLEPMFNPSEEKYDIYMTGFNEGINRVKEIYETPSCQFCKWVSFFEDESVGISPYVDGCLCPDVPDFLYKSMIDCYEKKYKNIRKIEDFLPKRCGCFKADFDALKVRW